MDILLKPIAPHMIVILAGCLVLLIRAYGKKAPIMLSGALTLVGLVAALVAAVVLRPESATPAFSGMVVQDSFSLLVILLVLLSAILCVMLSFDYTQRIGIAQGEFYALFLFAVSGMMFLGSATDLVTVFLGVEIMSISVYVLVGFNRHRMESTEAAIKYLILGAFASGFLLYGISMIYGATGTTGISQIAEFYKSHGPSQSGPFFMIGLGLLIIGFGFKIGAAPFHMWVPDVYHGAPTSITAFMATGVKAAGVAVFLRVLMFAFPDSAENWVPLIQIIAMATMTVGNFAALVQTNMKRMLAYSSIAHAGYILVGIVATYGIGFEGKAVTSVFFYLLAYTVMNIGAFGVMILLGKGNEEYESIEDYKGLAQRRPWAAFLLALFLLSLAGIPPTAGFAGKFYIFTSAMRGGFIALVVIGVLNSALSAYYYLRPLIIMYMSDPAEQIEEATARRPALAVALGLTAILTLELGMGLLAYLVGGGSYFEMISRAIAKVM
ncbi:MAG: NADH-quinone oxidoreductase subunit N [Deltaproteobacteria bacterium]|nr:NADH-quinone oxidoreductase subunit N [Deltaproteobacteria bacterium]